MRADQVAPHGNLETRAQVVQLRFGVLLVTIGLAIAVLLARSAVATTWRVAVFAPLFLGVYGVAAALYKTCGFTAIAGRRITAEGPEIVADPMELSALRRTGVKIIAASVAIAATATALLVVAR